MVAHLTFREWLESRPPDVYVRPLVPPVGLRANSLFLLANTTWNDFGYRTSFLVHHAAGGRWETIGNWRIAQLNQPTGEHTWDLIGRPDHLNAVPPDCFSLADSVSSYEALVNTIGIDQTLELLRALNDVTANPEREAAVRTSEVYETSLMRTNRSMEALESGRPLLGLAPADVVSTFSASLAVPGARGPHRFRFDFTPDRVVPTPIHVLVGLNGTGKTQAMAKLARLLSRYSAADDQPALFGDERFDEADAVDPRPSIYGVLAISFSAFDEFERPEPRASELFNYVYCGLDSLSDGSAGRTPAVWQVRTRLDALNDFQRAEALKPLRPTLRAFYGMDDNDLNVDVSSLSAGQRILLSMCCEIVRNVKNRTLVMLDEPETHLHPQLLSGLLAWLGAYLRNRNSFAIVATHSPIVVQQVPAEAVSILDRRVARPIVRNPAIETFGANLTDIVRDVFQDTAGDRNYQSVLEEMLDRLGSVDAVLGAFGDRLGMNAEIYLRGIAIGEERRPME